ncbi:DUF2066 domain-containing protein [Vibrio algivorus]|uniref:DUF2066 domain-containing protein n=1 Tax=Vibrio algivorus TaxID=1667024 RepID=A0ABQ6ER60_9VIBR|nr:DUF2066 domain-containing protein [Vibrio algivorus]GLT15633.1 hypothetical protein GCM10007931_26080 [Vibrio algivorus]
MRYLVIPLVASILFPLTTVAKTTVDVYHAEVVLSNEKNARSIAWGEGLEQVLVKASGNADIADNEVVKKAMRDGSDYLAKFKYGTLNGQKSLDMQYSPKQIRVLLSQANASVWPKERENVLVWLVQDDNVERQVGWEQSGLDSVAALQTAAQQSGLPITLPLGDMDDLTKISAPDLWGNFPEPLEEASVRYPADSVLVLKVAANGPSSEVNWQLYDMAPDSITSSPQSAITGVETGEVAQAIDKAIAKISAYYAKKNKPSSKQVADDALWAHFSGIQSAQSFFNLERSLLNLESVATVQVHSIQGMNVTFNIQLLSNKADFEKQVTGFKGIEKTQAPVDSAKVAEQAATEQLIQADESQKVNQTATQEMNEVDPDISEPEEETADEVLPVEQQLWFSL